MTLSDLFTLADRHSQELKLKRTEIEVATKGIEVARVQMEMPNVTMSAVPSCYDSTL